MTQIRDIVDEREYAQNLLAGNIRVQSHPEFPELRIANYTDQVAFKRDWNSVTRMCRGLIWNDETGEVLARPFPKFFNFDEPEAPRILDDQVVWHWDNKFDGSLGIMYVDPQGTRRIATRGSFQSEQAKLATDLLWDMPNVDVNRFEEMIRWGYTPLFEICGPSNRIVLRYEKDFLQPLGFVHMQSGAFIPEASARKRTMRDLLGDLSRSNAEGWVVWLSNTKAVKIKQADYIELHRMVSNLTEKEVWRQLRAGTYSTYVKELPDELYQLAEGWADGLRDQFSRTMATADVMLSLLRHNLGADATRKDQALWIQKTVIPEARGLVFGLLDGKDISDSIWKMLEVKG